MQYAPASVMCLNNRMFMLPPPNVGIGLVPLRRHPKNPGIGDLPRLQTDQMQE